MTSFHASSKEVLGLHNHDIFKECDNDSVVDQKATIAMVSSLDLENIFSSSSSSWINDDSNRSIASFTTHWSTATAEMSNTTKRRSEKKMKKKNFLLFLIILMKLVEEKDKKIFQNAKAVICNCEQLKKRGVIESFIESLRAPLKHVVGPQYWREARERLSRKLLYSKNKTMSSVDSGEGTTESSALRSTNRESSLRYGLEGSSPSSSPTMPESKTSTKTNNKEMRTRRKRLWMIISIFMQYLQRKHAKLYLKAHALVNDCVQRHKDNSQYERCSSLSGSIQSCLKNEIGVEHWRRAEKYVAKILLAHDKRNNAVERGGRIFSRNEQ